MVHVYYHIYAIDGVEDIITEQLNLIKKHFDFPYTLNVGISIANEHENKSISKILSLIDKSCLKDVRTKGNEFVTLDLIENDRKKFGESDYILYIHTKGASRLKNDNYKLMEAWRHYMNFYNIEKVNNVFKCFQKSGYNTFGCNFVEIENQNAKKHYSGNFWWAKSEYIKTLDLSDVNKTNRGNAELKYIQMGKDWKPYCAHYANKNLYQHLLEKNEYAKSIL